MLISSPSTVWTLWTNFFNTLFCLKLRYAIIYNIPQHISYVALIPPLETSEALVTILPRHHIIVCLYDRIAFLEQGDCKPWTCFGLTVPLN